MAKDHFESVRKSASLTVQTPDNLARFCLPFGDWVSLRYKDDIYGFRVDGFVPGDTKSLDLFVVRLKDMSLDHPQIAEKVGYTPVPPGEPCTPQGLPEDWPFPIGWDPREECGDPTSHTQGGQCCVTCGDTTACAGCMVVLDCGSCCVGECC